MEELGAGKAESQQILKVLEALKQAAQDLQTSSSTSNNSIKALLQLQTESNSLLSSDPHLSDLSSLLFDLKNLIQSQEESSKHGPGIKSFLAMRVKAHEISKLAYRIQVEIQAWIDRETVFNLAESLKLYRASLSDEEILVARLSQFKDRLLQGFNIKLQELLLKSGIFGELEWVFCKGSVTKRVREKAAYALKELVLFNKDVFVGQVLMGQTIKALVGMDSLCSLEVLCALVRAIRSPFVDEIEAVGGILKIVSYLENDDMGLRIMAMDCVMDIGYFGRKEAVEAMLNAGLIKRLMELQRSELGGDLIDFGKGKKEVAREGGERGVDVGGCEKRGRRMRGCQEMRYLEKHPFASCVARFAVQLEVGEGLRQREKRAFKQEILKRVRETSVSDAEAATIMAEVLWGSSP